MNQSPRIFLIAGEPSGDRLGGALMAGLAEVLGDDAPVPEYQGIGGPEMAAHGLKSRFPMEELSLMGLAEILPHIPRLLRRIRETADAVEAARPDVLVTIDSPDFCLRVAKKVRRQVPELPIVHYVAPTVWAWRPGRARKMARSVDHVLALLPFEPPYMEAAGMSCDFVGHPVSTVSQASDAECQEFRRDHGIPPDSPLLAVLPGSRHGEVERLAPIFAETVVQLRATRPDLSVVVPLVGTVSARVREIMGEHAGLVYLEPRADYPAAGEARKRAAFGAADLALAASGTVSLELAAAGLPVVIGYRASALTAFLLRRMILVDTVTLTNLVTETRVVPEFLQEDCAPDRLVSEINRLLGDPEALSEHQEVADRAMDLLGRGGEPPGIRAARSVLAQIGLSSPER